MAQKAPTPATPSPQGRYWVNVSAYFFYMLCIEAWLKGRSLPEEAGSLLCAKLGEREGKRGEMLAFNAARMGISKDELIAGILNGTIAHDLTYINPEDKPENAAD